MKVSVSIQPIGYSGISNLGYVNSFIALSLNVALAAIVDVRLPNEAILMGARQIVPLAEDRDLSSIPSFVELEDGVKAINTLDSNGLNRLHRACNAGNLQLVQKLVAHGADLEIADRNGQTALDVSMAHPNFEIAEFLLEKGAKIGRKPLYYPPSCCWRIIRESMDTHNLGRIRLLVQAGFDPMYKAEASTKTPFEYACAREYLAEFKIFTGTESIPALKTCQSISQLLDALFGIATRDMIDSHLKTPDSPEIQEFKQFCLTRKEGFQITEGCGDSRDIITYLKENNLRFAKAWDLLNEKTPVRRLNFCNEPIGYSPDEHQFALSAPYTQDRIAQIFQAIGWGLYRRELVELYQKAKNGELNINQFTAADIAIGIKASYLSQLIVDPNQLDPDFFSKKLEEYAANENPYAPFSRKIWQIEFSLEFFRNNPTWLKWVKENSQKI